MSSRVKAGQGDLELLAQYVAAFEKLDELMSSCPDDIPEPLRTSTDEDGWQHWRPIQASTAPEALQALYDGLGLPGRDSTRFPPLYETLVLSYRWAQVDLGTYYLAANLPADDLSPLLSVLRLDTPMFGTLLPNGYVEFARESCSRYDVICFDFRARQSDGDCRIVKLDHEEVYIKDRIREVGEVASSFRSLVLQTIELAASGSAAP